jgi:hypothetical protein
VNPRNQIKGYFKNLSDFRDRVSQHPDEFKSKGMQSVASSEGEAMQKVIKAQKYIECSAGTQDHMKEVVEETMKVVFHPLSEGTNGVESEHKRTCFRVAQSTHISWLSLFL